VLYPDDRRRADDVTISDHRRRLGKREPPDRLGLVTVMDADPVGATGQVEALLTVRRPDDRLEGHDVLDRARPVPGLLDDLASSGIRAVLGRVDVAAATVTGLASSDVPDSGAIVISNS
jgi:hypothetical protein